MNQPTPDPIDLWLYRLFMGLVFATVPFIVLAALVLFIGIFQ